MNSSLKFFPHTHTHSSWSLVHHDDDTTKPKDTKPSMPSLSPHDALELPLILSSFFGVAHIFATSFLSSCPFVHPTPQQLHPSPAVTTTTDKATTVIRTTSTKTTTTTAAALAATSITIKTPLTPILSSAGSWTRRMIHPASNTFLYWPKHRSAFPHNHNTRKNSNNHVEIRMILLP